jgi:diaminohydroxyphosphoribosylaminopyrimidine deaminase/5-amino-6-(5-phosphoribosylamino)uracil reductase
MRRRRPFVTMKVALSQDDRVAARPGERTMLTGAAANRVIHRERAEVDAIAIGSGTVLADDPVLTPRGAYRTRPLTRVIFDRSLRTPPTARMLSTLATGPIMVVSGEPGDEGARHRAEVLAEAGVEILSVAPGMAGSFLAAALAELALRGIMSLTVEGGPALHASLWTEGLVDRVQLFRTPWSLGSAGVPWLNGETFSLDVVAEKTVTPLGADVLIEGYVHRAD